MGSCSKTLMKNKILYLLLIFFSNFLIWSSANSIEQFNFDVTEVEILNNGNIVKGLKRGTISTNEGILINADTFEFDKISNKLYGSSGNCWLVYESAKSNPGVEFEIPSCFIDQNTDLWVHPRYPNKKYAQQLLELKTEFLEEVQCSF